MTTLINYYQEIKEKLKSQLEVNTTPEAVAKIVQTEVNKLADIDSEYIQSLTPPQARLARVMLQWLSQSANILILVKPQMDAISPNGIEISNNKSTLSELTSQVLSPVTKIVETQQNLQNLTSPNYYKQTIIQKLQQSREIYSSLLAGSLAGTLEGGWTWGLVGAIIGAVSGSAIFFWNAKVGSSKKSSENTKIIAAKPILKITTDTDKLLNYIYQSLQSIDITVASYGSNEKQFKPGIENNLDFLEYLQDLMSDALDKNTQIPIAVRRRIEQAATILRRNGIEVRVYKPEQEQDSMFYFEPSLDSETTDYITLKHAFIKDNQVLLPGYVIEPISN
jgi:hypothetical protein